MKGCFVTTKIPDICKENETGIYEKIEAEYKAFEKKYDMCFITRGWKKIFFYKILARIPFFPNEFNPFGRNDYDCDFIYFRLDQGDRQTIRFLKSIKQENPKCRIVIEIPTYPLSWHSLPLYTRINYPKHRYCEKRLKCYADRIAIFDDRDELYGVKTIKIANGIDFDVVEPRDIKAIDTDTISILSVSSLGKTHAVERLVQGIADYYIHGGKRNITLHVVGDGQGLPKCKKIVEMSNLGHHVVFHGYKTGKPLKDVFEKCTIGVDMLGGHRTNGNMSSTLKSRQYMANGMPIISSAEYPSEMKEIKEYIFSCPPDDTPIDVVQLCQFYDKIFNGGRRDEIEKVCKKIRSFAERVYSISNTLRPVFDYLDKENETTHN